MSFTLTRPAAGLALLAVLATGCSAAAAGYHAAAQPAASSSSSGSAVKTATVRRFGLGLQVGTGRPPSAGCKIA